MIFKKRQLSKVANFSFTLNQLRQRTRHNKCIYDVMKSVLYLVQKYKIFQISL